MPLRRWSLWKRKNELKCDTIIWISKELSKQREQQVQWPWDVFEVYQRGPVRSLVSRSEVESEGGWRAGSLQRPVDHDKDRSRIDCGTKTNAIEDNRGTKLYRRWWNHQRSFSVVLVLGSCHPPLKLQLLLCAESPRKWSLPSALNAIEWLSS